MTCGEHCDGESSLIPGTRRHRKLDRLPARCFQRERKCAFSTQLTAQEDSVLWDTFRSCCDHLWQAVSKSLRRCPGLGILVLMSRSLLSMDWNEQLASQYTGCSRSDELSLLRLGSKKTRAFVLRALSRPLLGSHDGTAQVSSEMPAGQVDTSIAASVRDPEPEPPSSAASGFQIRRNQL